jgi:hypothetical protein
MDNILALIIVSTIILFLAYKTLKISKYNPPKVIIGHRKYYDVVNRLYVDVVDYDGVTVFYKFEVESENYDLQTLPEKDFLKRFRKVGNDIRSVNDNHFIE